MKVTTTILSLSLSAITILPAAASDISSSDRASWIEQTLNSSASTKSAKKTTTLSGRVVSSNSITSTSGSSLSHSVSSLFPGVKMRPFVPNRYLPSEHDIELSQTQAPTQTAAVASAPQPQLPASTVQLAKAMAQTQAMTAAQRQMQTGIAYTGGYTGMGANAAANAASNNQFATRQSVPARTHMTAMQTRVNTLDAAIPEPMSNDETIGQIRSTLRSHRGGQLVASASTTNLYPDIVGPVPTQATMNTKSAQPSPLSFLAKNSTRQLGNSAGNANYSSYNSNTSASTYGTYTGQQPQQYVQQAAVAQRPSASLTYGGFQSYTGKVHVQAPSVRNIAPATQTQSGRSTYTSSMPTDCNIASADCYAASGSTKVASYASYTSGQSFSSSLPY